MASNKVRACIVIAALLVGLSGFWQTSESLVSAPLGIVDAAPFAKQLPDRLLLLFAWKPLLIVSQLKELTSHQEFSGVIILLCPHLEDVELARRIIAVEELGAVTVFFYPVDNRAKLFNSRYVLEASSAFLNQRAALREARHQGAAKSTAMVIDLTRATVCGDILHEVRASHVALISIPLAGKASFAAEYTKALVFSEQPLFASMDAPHRMGLPPMAFAPQVFGGSVENVIRILNLTNDLLDNVQPGMAIEPFFTRGVSTTLTSIGQVSLISRVEHRRMLSPCDAAAPARGSEGPDRVSAVCHRRSADPHVVLNAFYCNPTLPKNLTTNVPATPERCRGIFVQPILKLTMHRPHLVESITRVPKAIRSVWRAMRYQGLPSSTTTASGASIRPSLDCSSSPVDVVLSVAMGYTPSKLRPFLKSFDRHHARRKTMLVLLVSDVAMFRSALSRSHDLLIVNASAYQNIRSRLHQCPVVLSRMEVMRNFLADYQSYAPIRCMARLLVLDSRDAMFQEDPFVALDQFHKTSVESIQRLSSTFETKDFLLLPTERYLLAEHDFLFFGPHVLNRFWVGGAFGMDFFYRLLREPLTGNASTSNGVTFPILCGGLYMGTATAIMDLLDVFVASAVALGGCSVNDQGLLIGLVAAGLGESRYPHPVFLADPYTTPFTNGPRGGEEIVFDTEGRVVDCNGVPYAVLHQYDRYKSLWKELSRA